jgi:hypothetical protein
MIRNMARSLLDSITVKNPCISSSLGDWGAGFLLLPARGRRFFRLTRYGDWHLFGWVSSELLTGQNRYFVPL